jgi:hypothetical protein
MTRIIRTTLTAILTAAALAACTVDGPRITATDTASPGAAVGKAAADAVKGQAPTAAKVGGTITVANGDTTAAWTLNEVRKDKRDEWHAAVNGLFISGRITVKATSGDTFASTTDITLVTADGQVVDQDYSASFANRHATITANLSEGQHATGWVFFDVTPAQAKGARLQLKQLALFGDDPVGYWAL